MLSLGSPKLELEGSPTPGKPLSRYIDKISLAKSNTKECFVHMRRNKQMRLVRMRATGWTSLFVWENTRGGAFQLECFEMALDKAVVSFPRADVLA